MAKLSSGSRGVNNLTELLFNSISNAREQTDRQVSISILKREAR